MEHASCGPPLKAEVESKLGAQVKDLVQYTDGASAAQLRFGTPSHSRFKISCMFDGD
jgi:hypothetical protein